MRTLSENDTGMPLGRLLRRKATSRPQPAHARQRRRGCTIGQTRPDVAFVGYHRHLRAGDDRSQPPHYTRSSIRTQRAQPAMFSGRMPWFSSICLASDSRSVRRNLRHSQVWQVMFSRAYTYLSPRNFPKLSIFEEAAHKVKFPALRGSPTVSGYV